MVKDGLDMIRIKLTPEDLGGVDIQMDVKNDGSTSIRIVAERSDTLDMLRKDSHLLEKALRDTGVKTDAGGMQFSLREGNQQQQFGGFTGKYKPAKEVSAINDNYLKSAALENVYNIKLRPDGVNILA
jgi:flagellar hook-length control protein FliK